MERGVLDDLALFAEVARLRSFTRAAEQVGLSTSALSYQIKRLEQRLGMRLLQRNSRSVSLTEAGGNLLRSLEPALDTIQSALHTLGHARDQVAGTVRITATRHAYEAILRPVLARFHALHPQAVLEVSIDHALRDIVAHRFDAGIRIGEMLEQDMIALSVGPPLRMAVVASPRYLKTHPAPLTPRELQQHQCINYRMRADGPLMSWEFREDGRDFEVRVKGPLTVNEPELAVQAALDHLGLAYTVEGRVEAELKSGKLVRVLDAWLPPFAGYYLYYPSRRQVPPALGALLGLLRERGG